MAKKKQSAKDVVHESARRAEEINEQLRLTLSQSPGLKKALEALTVPISWDQDPVVQSAMNLLIDQTKRQLDIAAEVARAIKLIELPKFNFPVIPEFQFPAVTAISPLEWPEIDWEAAMKVNIRGIIRLSKRGWTAASWMTFPESRHLEKCSDEEVDAFFVEKYMGNNTDEGQGQLEKTAKSLLTSAGLDKWQALLMEIFDCMRDGKHKICIPALVAVLDGFTVESLVKRGKGNIRDTNARYALKRAQLDDDRTFQGNMWRSTVLFMDEMFKSHDFASVPPPLINRHWILHGRSATDWTVADALRVPNAIASMEWMFKFVE